MIQIRDQKYSEKALIERGHELLKRGGPFAPAEAALLGASWPLVREAPIRSLEDAKLHKVAKAMHVLDRPEKPAPIPTPFDDAIAEAEEAYEPIREQFEAAKEAWFSASARANELEGGLQMGGRGFWDFRGPRRSTTERELEAAKVAENAARGEYLRTRQAYEKARAKLNDLRNRASHWRAVPPAETSPEPAAAG